MHTDMHAGGRSGFTLLEMLITISIIVIIVSVVLINYTTFTSRSGLRVRAAEVAEFIRFAQERSASSELLDTSDAALAPTRGFQIVRMKVRDGLLNEFRIEKFAGPFTGFANFDTAGSGDVPKNRITTLPPQEEYFVDVCYINTDGSPAYVRKSLKQGSANCTSASPTYMLCGEPNISVSDDVVALEAAQRNNFDVHFSVEQPTREVHANIISVNDAGALQYNAGNVQPNGPSERESDIYEGVRVVLITPTGLRRSVDVYRTGLITTKADNTTDGCESLSPPGNLSASISSGIVTLSWDNPPDTSITTYQYRVSENGGSFGSWSGEITPSRGTTRTVYSFAGLDIDNWYTFELRAVAETSTGPEAVYTLARSCAADSSVTIGTCTGSLPSGNHGNQESITPTGGDGTATGTYICTNGVWASTDAGCRPGPQDGQCGESEDVCLGGTSSNEHVDDDEIYYRWQCLGQNDGANAPQTCTALRPGQCNNSVLNDCTTGTSADIDDSTTHYLWQCTGMGNPNNCSKLRPGECDETGQYGCTTGTSNPDAEPDTTTDLNWRCDGDPQSRLCTKPKPGQCSDPLVLNTCSVGNYAFVNNSTTHYLWQCTVDGEDPTDCSLERPGQCSNPSVLNQCNTGSLNDIPDSDENHLWQCTGAGSPDNCSLARSRPGQCSDPLVLNTCSVGNYAFVNNSTTHYLWQCTVDGEDPTDCSLERPGQCSNPSVLNQCNTGSLNDIPDSDENHLWQCTGAGSPDNCSLARSSCSIPLGTLAVGTTVEETRTLNSDCTTIFPPQEAPAKFFTFTLASAATVTIVITESTQSIGYYIDLWSQGTYDSTGIYSYLEEERGNPPLTLTQQISAAGDYLFEISHSSSATSNSTISFTVTVSS